MKQTILAALILIFAGSSFADDMAVTVYNSNLGVISETRELDVIKGTGKLAIQDVPSQIDPASVRFNIVGDGNGFALLEQNYAYDLVSPDKINSKYIDHEIEMVDKKGNLYKGTLLSANRSSFILMDENKKIKTINGDNIAEINFPALPDGLITRPTLFWLYNSNVADKLKTNISYQTGGMNWTAEYVGLLSSDEKTLDLSGWASITNNSGKTFNDAKLKLVAGDIQRADQVNIRGGRMMETSYMVDKAAGFEEKSFFEYHLYTLPRKATLANNEQKQISLFDPAQSGVTKSFMYQPEKNNEQVAVVIEMKNSQDNGLGMPLPEGRVRLFKADDDGSLILLGEDNIDHTPKDETLKMRVGYAFDIKAKEDLMNQRRISNKVEERDIKVELTNHKETEVVVEYEKQLYGYWEITAANFDYNKKNANTITGKVKIAPDETITLEYTVRYVH